jgi:excinuclease UvrABC helicase subunit UvrB
MNIVMKSKIDIEDFLIIINWVKTIIEFEGKNFPYQNLYDQAETYKLKNTPLDTQIHHIDEFMIDAFKVYIKMKKTEVEFEKLLDDIPFIPFGIKKESFIDHVKKYQTICEDLMLNYKYEDPEIRAIQIGFLTEKMNEFAINEEYEKAAELRDYIKTC